jgi:hypothetical protein
MKNNIEKQNISPAKSSLQFGIFFGILMILEMVLSFSLNIGPENKLFGILMNLCNFLIFPFIFIYFACNNYKNNFNNGYINFSQCIKIGLSVALIASLIYSLFNILFNLIFPEYLPEMIEQVKKITVQQNREASSEQLKMMLSMIDKMSNQYVTIPLAIIVNCFIALIHSLIVGAIAKKDI